MTTQNLWSYNVMVQSSSSLSSALPLNMFLCDNFRCGWPVIMKLWYHFINPLRKVLTDLELRANMGHSIKLTFFGSDLKNFFLIPYENPCLHFSIWFQISLWFRVKRVKGTTTQKNRLFIFRLILKIFIWISNFVQYSIQTSCYQ